MAVYYISRASGDDSNDGLTESTPWLNLYKGFDTVATGDQVYIKADADYGLTGTATVRHVPNSPSGGVSFIGYSNTTGDNRQIAITGRIATHFLFTGGVITFEFKNMLFSGASTQAISILGNNTANMSSRFVNLTFIDNQIGISKAANTNLYYNCLFTSTTGGNSSVGIDVNGGGDLIYGCTFKDLAFASIDLSNSATATMIVNNLFINCKGPHIVNGTLGGAGVTGPIIGNTFLGPSGDGINFRLANAPCWAIMNNIFANFQEPGKAAIIFNNGGPTRTQFYNNAFFGNTINISGGTLGDIGFNSNDIDGLDPQITNSGALDFRIGSNLKASGIPYVWQGTNTTGFFDIGAVQRKEDYPVITNVLNGVIYANADLTGTATAGGGGGNTIVGGFNIFNKGF